MQTQLCMQAKLGGSIQVQVHVLPDTLQPKARLLTPSLEASRRLVLLKGCWRGGAPCGMPVWQL